MNWIRTCRIRKVFFDIDARAPHCDPTMYALVTMGWERWIEASRELLRETISVELMHERVDALAEMIDEHIQADSKGPGYATWQQAVDRLHDEIDDRWQYIEAKIDAWDANAETSRREPSDGFRPDSPWRHSGRWYRWRAFPAMSRSKAIGFRRSGTFPD